MNLICLVDYIGNLCNDVEFQKDLLITGITALITVLTVIISNYITLRINNKNLKCSKQQFEKTLDEQKKQFEQQIVLQIKQFNETIQRDNERDRVSIMPYFELNENINIIYDDEIVKFPLEFTNIGNGTAIRTQIEIQNLVAYEDISYNIKYLQSLPMSAMVVRTEKSTETMIETKFKEGAHEVIISLCFEDMMNRQYKQKFSFYYESNRNNRISVEKHFAPECLKDCL